MLEKLKNIKQVTLDKMSQVRPVSQAEQTKYLVALDVGTENVKALIGRLRPDDGGLDIVGVGRARQSLSDMQAGAIADIGGVVENCDKALAKAEQQAQISVRSSVIGIAGELVKGTTTTTRVVRKEPKKPLDMAEVERIIKLVQERAETKAREQLAVELGGKKIDVRLVNSALVSIEIDGYLVTNPVGFQGSDVMVQLYTAFAPLIHIGALERTAEQLDLDLVAVAAEPFAVARSMIGNDQSGSMSAILIDIGGGTTDIAVVNEGGVQGTKTFGIGGRAFTRAVEKTLGVSYEEAEKLKIDFSSGKVPERQAKEVETALSRTLDVWMSGIDLALGDFPKLDHLPSRIYLCGGGSSLRILIERLQQSDWYKTLAFTRRPSVQLIRPQQVVGINDATETVNDHTYITAMGLLRVGLDTVQINGAGSGSMKEKIDRILHV